MNWDDVKSYLETYVGEFYEIADTKDIVYIGKELPDEYTGSRYTYLLKGANAKAKANASQGIPEMLDIATGKHFRENVSLRHYGYKKRNEQPFRIIRFYLAKTPFLFHSIRYAALAVKQFFI